MSWYYASNQQQLGPLNEEEFRQKISSGEIAPSTLVWQEGMADWKPLAEVGAGFLAGEPGKVLCLCGNLFPVEETVKIGERQVCPACKDIALQRLMEGVLSGTGMKYAGFWIRFAAKFIDGILLAVVNMSIQFGLTFAMGAMSLTQKSGDPQSVQSAVLMVALVLVIFILQMLVYAGYSIYFTGKNGATPGKMLCRLKVVRPDGSPLSYKRAAARFFAEFVSQITCYIGYILTAFDEEKRSLHDRIADTRVIQQS